MVEKGEDSATKEVEEDSVEEEEIPLEKERKTTRTRWKVMGGKWRRKRKRRSCKRRCFGNEATGDEKEDEEDEEKRGVEERPKAVGRKCHQLFQKKERFAGRK